MPWSRRPADVIGAGFSVCGPVSVLNTTSTLSIWYQNAGVASAQLEPALQLLPLDLGVDHTLVTEL